MVTNRQHCGSFARPGSALPRLPQHDWSEAVILKGCAVNLKRLAGFSASPALELTPLELLESFPALSPPLNHPWQAGVVFERPSFNYKRCLLQSQGNYSILWVLELISNDQQCAKNPTRLTLSGVFLLTSVCRCIIMCVYEWTNFKNYIIKLKLPGVRQVCGEFLVHSPRPRFI